MKYIVNLEQNNNTIKKLIISCPIIAATYNVSNALKCCFMIMIILITTNIIFYFLRPLINKEIYTTIYLLILFTFLNIMHILSHIWISLYYNITILVTLIITNFNISSQIHAITLHNNVIQLLIDSILITLKIFIIMLFLSVIREIIGQGTLFNDTYWLFGSWSRVMQFKNLSPPIFIATVPAGGFLMLGIFIAVTNFFLNTFKI